MSLRGGTVTPIIKAAAILGSAAGLNVPLLNQWGIVPGFFLTYTATATVGNRGPILIQIKDNAGNILMQTAATTAITAGQTPKIIGMPGQPFTAITTPLTQIVPWPFELPVPLSASMQILDSANIDPNDTVAVNIPLAQ